MSGRYPLPPGLRRDEKVVVLVRPTTAARWRAQATAAGEPNLSAWIRKRLGEEPDANEPSEVSATTDAP